LNAAFALAFALRFAKLAAALLPRVWRQGIIASSRKVECFAGEEFKRNLGRPTADVV
jgi:hypothetical protein